MYTMIDDSRAIEILYVYCVAIFTLLNSKYCLYIVCRTPTYILKNETIRRIPMFSTTKIYYYQRVRLNFSHGYIFIN